MKNRANTIPFSRTLLNQAIVVTLAAGAASAVSPVWAAPVDSSCLLSGEIHVYAVNNTNGACIIGDAAANDAATIDPGAIISGVTTGVYVDVGISADAITNSGLIDVTGYGVYLNQATLGGGSAQVDGINNTALGIILASDTGIYIYSSTIVGSSVNNGIINSGLIDAGAIGINVDGVHSTIGGISNDATGIILASDTGIFIQSSTITGGLSNSGSINAGTVGINLVHASLSGGISNGSTGTILASDTGIFIQSSTITGGLSNSGSISAGTVGINLVHANLSGGISNAGTATILAGDTGMLISSSSTITGAISNSGTILGGYGLVLKDSTAGTIDNNLGGTIYGNDGYGILIDSSASISGTIINQGLIAGGDAGTLGDDYAIYVDSTAHVGTIANYVGGILDGGVAIYDDTTDFTNSGTINTHHTESTITGDYLQTPAGQFALDALNTTPGSGYGALTVDGLATFNDGAEIAVHLDVGNTLALHQILNDVITAGTLEAGLLEVTDNSETLNFFAFIDDDNTVDLYTVYDRNISDVVDGAGLDAGSGLAEFLDDLINGGSTDDPDLLDLLITIGSLGTDQEVVDAVESLLPLMSGGMDKVLGDIAGDTDRIIQSHHTDFDGMSTGDHAGDDSNVWVKPFVSSAEQNDHSNIAGYTADSTGFVVGVDSDATNLLHLGVAGAVSKTSADSNGAGSQSADIDNYQAIFYGSYVDSADREVNFQLDYGKQSIDGTKTVLGSIYTSSFNSHNAHAGIGFGRHYQISEATSLTPSLRADYGNIKIDGYVEKGVFDQNRESQNVDSFVYSYRATLVHAFTPKTKLKALLGIGYDTQKEQSSVTSSFVGGGGTYVTDGLKPSPIIINAGIGVDVSAGKNLTLSARYDAESRSDYLNQTISAKAKWAF